MDTTVIRRLDERGEAVSEARIYSLPLITDQPGGILLAIWRFARNPGGEFVFSGNTTEAGISYRTGTG